MAERTVLPSWMLRTLAYCVALLLFGLTVWVTAWVAMRFAVVTGSLVAALLLGALLAPASRVLERRGLPPALAALSTILLALVVVAGAMVLVIGRAIAQVGDLRAQLVDGVDQLRSLLSHAPLELSGQQIDETERALVRGLERALPDPVAGATLVSQLLSGAVLAVFLLFFLIKDGASIWRWTLSWVATPWVQTIDRAGETAWRVLSQYMGGVLIIAAADALGIGLVLVVLGVPLAASLTCLVFIGAFVPIVGAFVSGGVAVVMTLLTLGPEQALIVLAAVVAVQQIEGNFLQPFVMGRALHLHPAAIVLVIAIGALAAGVLGAVVAVPLAAASYRAVDELATRNGRGPPPPDGGGG